MKIDRNSGVKAGLIFFLIALVYFIAFLFCAA